MPVKVTAYQAHHRAGVMRFIENHPQCHHHLDWEPVQTWLRDPLNIIALAWDEDELCGLMAFSPAHAEATWLRLLALPSEQRSEVFQALWEYLRPQLQVEVVATMSMRYWLPTQLEEVGFGLTERVISLRRFAQPLPLLIPDKVKIRRVRWWEFSKVLAVDHAAFGALWQLRPSELHEAARRAHYYTVAILDSQIVGYQLSMLYSESIHLSRLATLPDYQSQGIGSSLLKDLLLFAEKSGIEITTVNTQASNHSSRRVYERFGFEDEGDELPIYTLRI